MPPQLWRHSCRVTRCIQQRPFHSSGFIGSPRFVRGRRGVASLRSPQGQGVSRGFWVGWHYVTRTSWKLKLEVVTQCWTVGAVGCHVQRALGDPRHEEVGLRAPGPCPLSSSCCDVTSATHPTGRGQRLRGRAGPGLAPNALQDDQSHGPSAIGPPTGREGSRAEQAESSHCERPARPSFESPWSWEAVGDDSVRGLAHRRMPRGVYTVHWPGQFEHTYPIVQGGQTNSQQEPNRRDMTTVRSATYSIAVVPLGSLNKKCTFLLYLTKFCCS